MATLEKDEIVDHWVEDGENNTDVYVELVVGYCPNCGQFFEYKQRYAHDPMGYEMLTDCAEDEEEEEE